jgi:outer membrane usher protein FimD/PapC
MRIMTSRSAGSGAKIVTAAVALMACLSGQGAVAVENNPLNAIDTSPAAYSLSFDRDKWSQGFSIFQMSVSEPLGTIASTLLATDDSRLKALTRLDTALSFSAPFLHMPTRLGDTVSSSAFWDQPVRMGGVQVGTLHPVLPDIVAPSVILGPDLLTMPGAASFASSRFIDHVNTVAQLQRPNLVSAGQTDYSLETGRVRQDFELRSNDYGTWLTSGTYRFGLTSMTTVDGQFAQVGVQQSMLGVGILEGLGAFGQLSARLANSRDNDGSGWLARMGYDYTHEKLNIAVRTHIQTAGYTPVGDIAAVEPLRQRTLASAGWDMGSLGKVSLASATQVFADETRRDVLALSHALPLSGGGILSASAAYSPGQIANSAVLFSLTYPFGYWSSPSTKLSSIVDSSLDRTVSSAFYQPRFTYSDSQLRNLVGRF